MNNRKQSVYCLGNCLKQLSHLAVFTSKLLNVSALWIMHSSRRRYWTMAWSSKRCKFAPLSDDRLLQLVDCRELSTLIDHLLKGIPNSIINRSNRSPSKLARSTLITQLVSVVADLSAISDISQGSVATYEVWWDLQQQCCYKFSSDFDSDKILKNGLYLIKLLAYKKLCQFFWPTLYSQEIAVIWAMWAPRNPRLLTSLLG